MKKGLFLLFYLCIATACSTLADKYGRLPEVAAWEDEIRAFETSDSSESYPENAILFTGSSSIRLWKTLERDMAPYPAIPRGFGGSRLSDFAVYGERIISPHPCSAIVIFIANDITGGEKDKTPREVASLFRFLLRTIRKTHPETPVFWIEITPTPSRWKAWPRISEANELIRRECNRNSNTYFISTASAFIGSDGLPPEKYFVGDKLHLNEEGYKLWSGIIKNEISKVVPYPETEIIAHRGASFLAPENTLAAAKLAWKLNSDAVECDIHLSADGRIVVNHDAGTLRTSGADMTIKSTHSDELRKLDVGSFKGESYKGEKIPFLEELIETVPDGKELVVEIKCGPGAIEPLKKIVKNSSGRIRFTFIAFDFNTIRLTKEALPENPCYWLCSDPALFSKNIGLVDGAGLEGVSLNFNIISPSVASEVRKRGLDLYTWTVDDPEIAKRMVQLGVKGITTNKPDIIRKELEL